MLWARAACETEKVISQTLDEMCLRGVHPWGDKRPVHYTVFLVAVNVRVAVK